MPPIAPTGVARIPIRIGKVDIELVGLGSAFAEYQQAHTGPGQGGEASKKADAASFLTFIRHADAEHEIAIKTDLRGKDILAIWREMEAAQPGSFDQMFARVGTVHGFQHHLGVINEPEDIEGIRVLVRALTKGSGQLRLAVQTTPKFRSEPLIRALNEAGIPVTSIGKPVGTQDKPVPSSVVAHESGAVTGRGPAVERSPGHESAWLARTRLRELRELRHTFATDGELIRIQKIDRETVQRELTVQIERLERLLDRRLELGLAGVAEGKTKTWTPDTAALAKNIVELQRVEGIEGRLTLADFEFARALSAESRTLRAIDREIHARRNAGEFSPELHRLIMSIEPRHAMALRLDKGESVSINEWHGRLSAQARTQSVVMQTGPVGWGQRGIGLGFLGVQLAMDLLPAIQGWQASNLAMNVHRGLRSLRWWRRPRRDAGARRGDGSRVRQSGSDLGSSNDPAPDQPQAVVARAQRAPRRREGAFAEHRGCRRPRRAVDRGDPRLGLARLRAVGEPERA